jgi:hypothetical protein
MAGGMKSVGYIADAYSHLLLGRTDDDLYNMEYTKYDIQKAKLFRDKYQERSMFRDLIAAEMGVSVPLIAKLQKIYRDHTARMVSA